MSRLSVCKISCIRLKAYVRYVNASCSREGQVVASTHRVGANRQLIANFLPTADRSVLIELTCQLIAQSSVGCAGPHRAMDLLSRFNSAHTVTSVGNRQRPHHGGTHARRIRSTPT